MASRTRSTTAACRLQRWASYGEWAPHPQGWAGKFLGVGESLIGVFMMALFLVTFTRKMTR